MPASLVALQILLILLPGFAAAYIVQLLASRGTQTDFDKVVEASLYSLIIYAAFEQVARGSLPFEFVSSKTSADVSILWHPNRLLYLALITIGLGLAVAAYTNLDGNRIFRWMKITERTSRRSIWNDVFQGEAKDGQVVQVELADGKSVIGVLSYYADDAADCSLFLEQASWVVESGDPIPIPGNGILITKNADIHSISFLDN
jgi:hypothetical protein